MRTPAVGLMRAIFFVLLLSRISGAMFPAIHHAQRAHNQSTAPFKSFALQLYDRYSEMPDHSILALKGFPVRYEHFKWILLFQVRLKYGNSNIQFFVLPEDLELFRQADLRNAPEIHYFRWDDGQLIEESREEFESDFK